jgi:hypothetical protein
MMEFPFTNTSSSDSASGIGIAVSEAPPLAEKSGAGGSGLRGLPPYSDEGVPGRGLPLRSAGSYETVDPAGLPQSVGTRDGVEGLIGDLGFAVGKGIEGARPKLEPGRELYELEAVGRYLSGDGRVEGGDL